MKKLVYVTYSIVENNVVMMLDDMAIIGYNARNASPYVVVKCRNGKKVKLSRSILPYLKYGINGIAKIGNMIMSNVLSDVKDITGRFVVFDITNNKIRVIGHKKDDNSEESKWVTEINSGSNITAFVDVMEKQLKEAGICKRKDTDIWNKINEFLERSINANIDDVMLVAKILEDEEGEPLVTEIKLGDDSLLSYIDKHKLIFTYNNNKAYGHVDMSKNNSVVIEILLKMDELRKKAIVRMKRNLKEMVDSDVVHVSNICPSTIGLVGTNGNIILSNRSVKSSTLNQELFLIIHNNKSFYVQSTVLDTINSILGEYFEDV